MTYLMETLEFYNMIIVGRPVLHEDNKYYAQV